MIKYVEYCLSKLSLESVVILVYDLQTHKLESWTDHFA